MGGSRLRIQLALVPSADAMRNARRLLETVPDLAPYPDLLFTVQLLTHELVTNSVRHGGLRDTAQVLLTVEAVEGTVSVEVAHEGAGFDALSVLARHFEQKELYHGLFLIDALADRWGFHRNGRCALSFALDLEPGRRAWRGREATSTRQPDTSP